MKSVVIDALTGRQVVAGDEEREATQPLVQYLVQRLGWHPRQIMTRPQWRVPKAPSGARTSGFPVDVAIFDSEERCGDPEHVRILVECKAPDEKTGIRQLKTYLGLEPAARLGIWFNGQAHALIYKTADGYVESRYAPIPRPGDPLSPVAAQTPLCYGDLVPPPNLRETFTRLRDQIAAQDTHVNRDEFILNDLANLIICKIADEQRGELDPKRPMAFQLAGSAENTAHAIRQFFEDVRNSLASVFTEDDDRLHIDDSSLQTVVETLQPYRLLGHDRQAVGTAFQVLRGRALKGEEGAYFTPPALVDCVVTLLDPDSDSRVVDPACGTGGFLAAALDHVFASVDAKSGVSSQAKERAKRTWARERLFAVDKDAVSTKLCKAYLTLLGDGRSHVYRANTIDRGNWHDRSDDLEREVRFERFDTALTNPPFGKDLKVSAKVGRQEGLITCRKWEKLNGKWEPTDEAREEQLGIVFFERCLELLEEKGHLAIVLPETFLFSTSYAWFVDWMCRTTTITHIVDVPMVAFEEFCRAKTCLVFVSKQEAPAGHMITMSYPKSIGQDKRGNALLALDGSGERTGELDNEMANAVKSMSSQTYKGTPKKVPRKGTSRLCFVTPQSTAHQRGVLVPRFWWREDTERALEAWAKEHPCTMVTLGDLADDGVLEDFSGHGSPPGNARGTGDVPYVKVTDLKNWRINENPTNFIHESVARKLRRRGPELKFGDLVTPARASSNIGQFSMILPWQTGVVLTREVLILRVKENDRGITPHLLLALLSLKVVQDQYEYLVLMQTNREHLGDGWREVTVPLPPRDADRLAVGEPVRSYFDSICRARKAFEDLHEIFDPEDFTTRP